MPPTMQTLKTSVLERFLRYVTYDTTSDENSTTCPSTAKQLVLLDHLAKELKAVGCTDVKRDEHGYVYGTIPATTKKANVPVIGFAAHVDTSPEVSGTNVKPIVHRDWNGSDIVLPDDPTQVLKRSEIPLLEEQLGHDIVTASGTTLLGADNKAGVAEIVAAAEYLIQHPEIPHGVVKIGFTPDEEIGRGADKFDVKGFGAFCAYTMDGQERGLVEAETFSADSMTFTFRGVNSHPGTAKGVMVNSIKVAADFLARIPKSGVTPETTEDRIGFVHPYVQSGSVAETSVKFIIRDFVTAGLAEKEAMLDRLAKEAVAAWPGSSVESKVQEQYRNMKEVLDRHPEIVENACEAIRRSGLAVREGSIRGGTDGSRLSFMGLPTPNIFAGECSIHSKLEWCSAQDMEKAVEVIVNLARVWEERA